MSLSYGDRNRAGRRPLFSVPPSFQGKGVRRLGSSPPATTEPDQVSQVLGLATAQREEVGVRLPRTNQDPVRLRPPPKRNLTGSNLASCKKLIHYLSKTAFVVPVCGPSRLAIVIVSLVETTTA